MVNKLDLSPRSIGISASIDQNIATPVVSRKCRDVVLCDKKCRDFASRCRDTLE